MRLQAVASLGAIIGKKARNDAMRREILDGVRSLIEDKYGTKMQRFKRFAASRHPPPDFLLSAACRVIGSAGIKDDISLMEQCLADESQDVRDAARHATGRLKTVYA